MKHTELSRRLAAAAPVTDSQVAELDLRDAETELLEEIMVTTSEDVVSDVDLHGSPPWKRRRHVVYRAAVAAAVLAAVLGGYMLNKDDKPDDDNESSTEVAATAGSPSSDLPQLVPGEVPDGFDIEDFVVYGQASSWDYAVFYGHEGGDGEIPVVDLSVRWLNKNDDATYGPADTYTPTPVRGHDGFSCSGSVCANVGPGVQASIEWTERPGTLFSLTSPSLTVDQLVAIADGLEIGGHPGDPADPEGTLGPSVVIDADEVALGELPADLPVALDRVGRRTYKPEADDGEGRVVVDENGHSTTPPAPPDFLHFDYRGADPTEALTVAVERGRGADIAALVADDGAEPTDDVRGHSAWSITRPPGGGYDVERRTLVWEEEPGVLVTIETFGTDLDLDDLRAVAEDMHLASPAEWEALLDVSDAMGSD